MGTYQISTREARAQRRWYIVDAQGKVLGRLASQVANILRGKHKTIFLPHADTGDFVIVVNARGIKLTGRKREEKIYYRHSEYPGGMRLTTAEKLLAAKPEFLIQTAVKGMLPKNRLGRHLFTKLKVYSGPNHPHAAQRPEPLPLSS
ncbi:MAG: 50S ribosomal protein L13 [Deltaproteobacteria bacterium]|nr:50S ribosomal protein L13 [Deltaproteobacteria bacterium]